MKSHTEICKQIVDWMNKDLGWVAWNSRCRVIRSRGAFFTVGVKGCSDITCLVPIETFIDGSLETIATVWFVEVKTEGSPEQRESQIAFEKWVSNVGARYDVVTALSEAKIILKYWSRS